MNEEPLSGEQAVLERKRRVFEEEKRVRGEQAWQLAAVPFSLGAVLPVLLEAPWRLRSFVAGMVLAAILWAAFQVLSARAAARLRIVEARLAEIAPQASEKAAEEESAASPGL